MDFDDLLVLRRQRARAVPGGPRALPARPSGYVLVDEYQDTNHAQYRWLRAARRRAAQPRAWSATTTSRSTAGAAPTSATSSTSSRDFPDAHGRQARAELPLDADDPDGRQRRDRAQPRAQAARSSGPTPARASRSRCVAAQDERDEARVRRRRDRAARRRRRVAARDRRLLPHERAVARARGGARARRGAVPGDRRHASSTSAPRSRTRWPTSRLLANPKTTSASRASSTCPRRGIGQTSLSRVLAQRGDARAAGLGCRGRGRKRCRDWARRRSTRSAASWT